MKYFTQQRFDALQTDCENKFELANQDWDLQTKAYDNHYLTIQDKLPGSVREFAEYSYHDAVVRSVSESKQAIVLDLELWPGNVPYRISFLDFEDYSFPELSGKGLWWLYEELSLHENSQYRIDILFGNGHGYVIANELEVHELT